jgi:hypothetical protein
MKLQKTAKARLELQPGARTLGQRERTLLLLADGQKTIRDVSPYFDDQLPHMVNRLVLDGYLERVAANLPLSADTPSLIGEISAPPPNVSKQEDSAKPPPEPANTKVAVDQFEGKRSLATTRMFLFDLCERLFARRVPELADVFREALRNATDRDSMLAVSRDMITAIEKVAGHERADSISERIAMLMPREAK